MRYKSVDRLTTIGFCPCLVATAEPGGIGIPKTRMIRLRRKTYEGLSEIADKEDYGLSELGDQVITDFIEDYQEECSNEDSDETEEDEEDIEIETGDEDFCPECGEPLPEDAEECPQCGQDLTEEE
ncbi:MAG: zinc-ribbon domain-containing protein [Thermoplasmata archaeon]